MSKGNQATTSSTRTFMTPPTEKPEPKSPRKPIKLARKLPWLLVLALIVVSLFLLQQYHSAQHKLKANSAPAVSKQVNDTINQVAKLVIVPANETPTVATVLNADKLKSQSFFANAKNGDKVLVYAKEKQAILYRPSTNQIVTMSTVTVSPTGSTSLDSQ
jgi:hypothetical protein